MAAHTLLSILAAVSVSIGQEPVAKLAPALSAGAPGTHVETLAKALDGGSGGLEVDALGQVYCADFGSQLGPGSQGGDKIFKIDPETGAAEIFTRGLRGASGNAIGPEGDFFQSNIGGSFITRVKPDGTASVFAREHMRQPVGIAIDAEGTLFVANCGSASITKISKAGVASVFVSDPLLACPNGITLDAAHNLYVSNFSNGNVIRISPVGKVAKLATLPGNNDGHLVHRAGKLYVVARGAHQIYTISLAEGTEGRVELFAGSGKRGRNDAPALEATFSFPNDIAFSPDGKTLYVNENGSTTEPHGSLAPMNVRAIRIAD